MTIQLAMTNGAHLKEICEEIDCYSPDWYGTSFWIQKKILDNSWWGRFWGWYDITKFCYVRFREGKVFVDVEIESDEAYAVASGLEVAGFNVTMIKT